MYNNRRWKGDKERIEKYMKDMEEYRNRDKEKGTRKRESEEEGRRKGK